MYAGKLMNKLIECSKPYPGILRPDGLYINERYSGCPQDKCHEESDGYMDPFSICQRKNLPECVLAIA
jgi:hypothetical protein